MCVCADDGALSDFKCVCAMWTKWNDLIRFLLLFGTYLGIFYVCQEGVPIFAKPDIATQQSHIGGFVLCSVREYQYECMCGGHILRVSAFRVA